MKIDTPLAITIGDGTEVTCGDLAQYYSSTNKKWMNSCIVAIQASTSLRWVKNQNTGTYEWKPVTEVKAWLGKNLRPNKEKPNTWVHSGTITYHDFKNIRSWDGT